MFRQRRRIARQNRRCGKRWKTAPMHGRTFISRRFNIITQSRRKSGFVTGLHHQRVNHGRPQVTAIIAQEIRQCTNFCLKPLRRTPRLVKSLALVGFNLSRHAQRDFRMRRILFRRFCKFYGRFNCGGQRYPVTRITHQRQQLRATA